jgi:hypothetical protein
MGLGDARWRAARGGAVACGRNGARVWAAWLGAVLGGARHGVVRRHVATMAQTARG